MSLPSVPSTQTNAANTPAQMQTIVWAVNPTTQAYDIFNAYTPDNNTGNLEVIQSKILITLSTFQGEWAAQPDFGIPFDSVNQNADNPDVLAQILVNQILTIQNVSGVSITNFNYIAATRVFQSDFNVNTVYGNITMSIGQ